MVQLELVVKVVLLVHVVQYGHFLLRLLLGEELSPAPLQLRLYLLLTLQCWIGCGLQRALKLDLTTVPSRQIY